MMNTDYKLVIEKTWNEFNGKQKIENIEDISANVSTNRVFRINLVNESPIIAKLSQFGEHEFFLEDHEIINSLANNLRFPHDHFIARSLNKENKIFCKRYKDHISNVWIVFYNPIRIKEKPPKIFTEAQIIKSGEQLAYFHKSCSSILNELPVSIKTMETDIIDLKRELHTKPKYKEANFIVKEIEKQCNTFLENCEKIGLHQMEKIPVFVDWNIGNFSVDKKFRFFSRWDYDWFRMSTRVMDFYFWSRVVRAEGDQDTFSYTINPMLEDRFIIFLKAYHKIFPLEKNEIKFIKESYRFFLLHYVVHLGDYFFRDTHAGRLKKETFASYFSSIDEFDTDKIINTLF
ncbi:hypothetical protein [Aquimarina agarivorans]|uniref:hypothetical protein n=1 Tax=Aquimarina agarivorans TaxID=980584 RepID=UPI000248EBF2|nr:hypothetical protein [Aquimarina agarivorans]